jgi:hypothetical protein
MKEGVVQEVLLARTTLRFWLMVPALLTGVPAASLLREGWRWTVTVLVLVVSITVGSSAYFDNCNYRFL